MDPLEVKRDRLLALIRDMGRVVVAETVHPEYRRVLATYLANLNVELLTIPTPHGLFRSCAYESRIDGRTHVALVLGEIGDGTSVLTRVHSECLTGDVFGSLRCDCGAQLDRALQMYILKHSGARNRRRKELTTATQAAVIGSLPPGRLLRASR